MTCLHVLFSEATDHQLKVTPPANTNSFNHCSDNVAEMVLDEAAAQPTSERDTVGISRRKRKATPEVIEYVYSIVFSSEYYSTLR